MPTGHDFVGRAEESAALAALLDNVVAGVGGAAWVEGEPGIGKSALVRHFIAIAASAGCTTSVGGADEMGWGSPLEAIRHALVPFDVAAPPRTAEHLIEQVEAACARGPVVVCFEDLHWADDASIAVWERLVAVTTRRPLLLLSTCRLLPRTGSVANLRLRLLDTGATLLILGPLSDGDLAQLVATMAGGSPGPGLLSLASRAGGNPLFVGEMLDGVRREDRLRSLDTGGVDLDPEHSSVSGQPILRRTVRGQLRFLSPETHKVMQVAAVAGAEVELAAVAALVRRPPEHLASIVAEAVAGGVLLAAAGILRFRHELVREALVNELPSAVRCTLQYQLAQHLDAAGAPLTLVASHVVAAEEAVDYWLVRWLTGTGEALSHLNPHVAMDLLARAFALIMPTAPDAEKLRAQTVRALYLLGRHEDLDQAAREIVTGTDNPARIAEMTWYRAASLLRLGQVARALAMLDDTLRGDQLGDRHTARVTALRAAALCNLGRGDEALESASHALSLGEQDGDRLAMGTALNARASVRIDRIETAAAMADLTRGLDVAADDPECTDLRLLLLTNSLSATSLGSAGGDADAMAARLLDEGERAGLPMRLSAIRATVASCWYGRGRFDDAVAAVEPVDLHGLRAEPGILAQAQGVLAAVAAHRGLSVQAEDHLHHVADLAPGEGQIAVNLLYSVYTQAMLAEQRGDLAAALSVLTDRMTAEVDRRFGQAALWLPDAVRLAMTIGDPNLARRAADLCADIGSGIRQARFACAGLRCRALLDSDPDLALAAVAQVDGSPWRYESARTHEDAAALLATAGRAELAKAHLTVATSHYAEMGAAWDGRRAAARLRSLGVRRGVSGTRGRPSTGWAALTETERRVAMHLGAGRTNPEIATALVISRRTVQTHVSHIMAKLGVRSRLDIAREAIGRTDPLDPASPR